MHDDDIQCLAEKHLEAQEDNMQDDDIQCLDPLPDEQAVSQMICTRLVNRGTSCYLNSLAFALTWLFRMSHFRALLVREVHDALRSILTTPSTPSSSDLLSLASWQPLLHGWPLGAQEDIAEFTQHILALFPMPAFQGEMLLLGHAGRQEVQPFNMLQVPVPQLDRRGPSTVSLQHIIEGWARAGDPLADRTVYLRAPPPFLLLQLLRFKYEKGRFVKITTPIQLGLRVQIPQLLWGEIVLVNYVCQALCLHHGMTPTSGHYTTILLDQHMYAASSHRERHCPRDTTCDTTCDNQAGSASNAAVICHSSSSSTSLSGHQGTDLAHPLMLASCAAYSDKLDTATGTGPLGAGDDLHTVLTHADMPMPKPHMLRDDAAPTRKLDLEEVNEIAATTIPECACTLVIA